MEIGEKGFVTCVIVSEKPVGVGGPKEHTATRRKSVTCGGLVEVESLDVFLCKLSASWKLRWADACADYTLINKVNRFCRETSGYWRVRI